MPWKTMETQLMTKPLRQTMPTVAGWIDELRAAFGPETINAAIKAGIDGQPTFYAKENGHSVGTPLLVRFANLDTTGMADERDLSPSLADDAKSSAGGSEPQTARDPGPTRKPIYELNETADGFALTVYLPGVQHSGLEVQADAENLTVIGRRTWKHPEGWTSLYRESDDTTYELVLSHENVVDHDKVQAELRDGVLRVALAKTEAVKPRKITVT
jgi:HSP20 family molecular chaperone IbpA